MGLLKKKKKEESGEPTEQTQQAKGGDDAKSTRPQKKSFIKKLIVLLVILGILGGGGFFAYTKFFSGSGKDPVYKTVPLAHVTLPDEMLAFCFAHMGELYDSLVAFNGEMDLFETEIARIDAVGAKYPDQMKIADSEKKIWVKGKDSLKKSFEKLEKPIKETYVLFQVNPTQGREKIDQTAEQLIQAAKEALEKAREQTAPLKDAMPKPPEGLVGGTLYKIKKMF
ncbi:hypothetical protein [uncultured Desulfobacter sp.]|uniref:hypothetical protein n=1 Tax=uncultured Desulfobacter sp. TaxID=240139 RepID=UPI002AAAFD26|nr:hypothetical protein [uncultured Desulfobacter sp.]